MLHLALGLVLPLAPAFLPAPAPAPAPLVIEDEDIRYARRSWQMAVLAGEHRLYDLATLLAWRLLGTKKIQFNADPFSFYKCKQIIF